MFNVFGDVIQRAYIANHKLITIDNGAFKLHYRVTFWMLLACTTLVCSRQYIGEHIRCIHDRGGLQTHVVNTFCFFTSTYTVIHESNATTYAHPGVSHHMDKEKIIRHAYYQWVPFVLFGQALLFYLPHLIWRTFEGGTIRNMVEGLQRLYLKSPDDADIQVYNFHIYSKKTESKMIKDINRQFQTITRFRLNRYWAVMLIFCEFLNLANVFMQLRVMDRFLGTSFINIAAKLLYGTDSENPFEIVFPKVTKCDFHKYGPSGSIQSYDVMCVMALNIVNEKIYCLLWFWFIFLIIFSVAALIWRFVGFILHAKSEKFNHYLLKEMTGRKQNPVDVAIITRQSCFSDWLLLYYLGKNIDSRLFTELLHNLATDIEESPQSTDFEDEKKPLKGA